MKLQNRRSHLIAILLSLLALFFSTTNATAQDAPVIGTLSFAKGCTIKVNGRVVPTGYQVHSGDVIATSSSCKAVINLADGGKLSIHTGTKVRVYQDGSNIVAAVLNGGVDYTPSVKPGPGDVPVIVATPGEGVDPLPYLAAFGGVNFPVGGGSTGDTANAALVALLVQNGVPASIALATASTVAKVLKAGGAITVTGANGQQITFGQLGSSGNGGTPVSIRNPNGTVTSSVLPNGTF